MTSPSLEEFAREEAQVDDQKGKLAADLVYAEDLNKYVAQPELLLAEWGLDQGQWVVDKIQVKAGLGVRLQVEIKKRWITEAEPTWVVRKPELAITRETSRRVVVMSDWQCPYHNQDFHERTCDFLRRTRPDVVVANGDGPDLPRLSRFRPNPYTDTAVQAGIDAYYTVLRDLRAAAPHAEFYVLPGNHEQRLQNQLLDKIPDLSGVRQAATSSTADPVLSLPFLLRLPELKAKWVVAENGEWPQAQLVLSPYLVVTHGWMARKGSGTTARATLEVLGHSVIVGHTHRLGQVYHTFHRVDGGLDVHVAIEGGTMTTVPGGLGYARSPDWQNGFTCVTIRPNGKFYPNLVFYNDGELLGGWS